MIGCLKVGPPLCKGLSGSDSGKVIASTIKWTITLALISAFSLIFAVAYNSTQQIGKPEADPKYTVVFWVLVHLFGEYLAVTALMLTKSQQAKKKFQQPRLIVVLLLLQQIRNKTI